MTRGQTLHTQDADFTLLNCDVLDGLRSLPDESVHCVVTSPPYWGLRCYGVDGQLGLEPTPEAYVAQMVEVFREVRRVLRSDGTCWVNLGDSYASVPGGQTQGENGQMADRFVVRARAQVRDPKAASGMGAPQRPPGLKPKDLAGMPWRVAFALQADGWYLRSDIIWSKPNPMPESVTDRPTKAHEYVFLLTKGPRYFFDQEAVREKYAPATIERDQYGYNHAFANQFRGSPTDERHPDGKVLPAGSFAKGPDGRKRTTVQGADGSIQHRDGERWPNGGRNVRSVWEIATQPYPEAHFATYPEELVRRCILAGSSERGCCPECGAPWERETERVDTGKRQKMTDGWDTGAGGHGTIHRDGREKGETGIPVLASVTLGWRPGCDCRYDIEEKTGPYPPIPCTVLDPFLGSGTTAYVARKHGRRSIGIELNPDYCNLAARRMQQQSLFAA